MKKKILTTAFSSILALFLAIVLLTGCLCVYARNTVCEPDDLLQTCQECGYCEELYDEIKYKWENLLSITGVTDSESIIAVLTPERVREDTIKYLRSAYSGKTDLDITDLKSHLETKVRDYAYSNNIHATPKEELDQNITDLVNACMQDYRGAIAIPLLPKLLKAATSITGYLKIGLYAAVACGLLLLVFLFFLQQKRRDTLYFAAISAATDAVLLIGLTGLANHYKLVARLPFDASALKTFVSAYLEHLLDRLNSMGVAFLCTAVVLLLLFALAWTCAALMQSKKVHKQNNSIG